MSDAPKVFEDGTLTVVFGSNGCSVYAGQKRIELLQGVTLGYDSDKGPVAEVRFLKSHDPETARKIEEEVRTASRVRGLLVRT